MLQQATDLKDDEDDPIINQLMEMIEDISFEIDDEYKSETDVESFTQYDLSSNGIPNFVIHINSIHELYEPQAQIGRGASGAVYLTRSKRTHKQHALKQMQQSDKFNRTSFVNEITVLKSLNHPDIVSFNDAYISSKHYFVVTEYCAGGTLHERIMKMKRFSERDCVGFMKTILNTIQYIHSKKIVHRDLKLSNIVFDSLDMKHSKLKIIDFGESKFIDKPEQIQRSIVGSPYYLPPETNSKSRFQKDLYAGDMWSIGVIAYMLIEGCYPYTPKNVHRIRKYVHRNALKWSDKILITDACKDFIQCLLHKNKHKRLTAQEAQQHPWITNQATDTNLGDAYFSRLETLNFSNKLQKVMVKSVLKDMNDADKKIVLSHDGYSDDTELINTILYEGSSFELMSPSLCSIDHTADISDASLEQMPFDEILAEIDEESGTFIPMAAVRSISPRAPSVDDTIAPQQFVQILEKATKNYDIAKILRNVSNNGVEPITFRKIAAYHEPMNTLRDNIDFSQLSAFEKN